MFQRKIKTRISTVEKVNYLSLTGHKAWVNLHNHLNSRIHLCWSIKIRTPYYKNCIDRSFIRKNDWLCLCKRLKIPSAVGLAACLVSGIKYVGDHRVERCIFFKKQFGQNALCGRGFVGNTKKQKLCATAWSVLH
jgi:hypothetical protein